jgi:hypothetical protein
MTKHYWRAFVNLSNTIGMLVNSSNYETFAKYMPRCINHLQKLCHLFFHQAPEVNGGCLIIDQLQLAYI